jgi:hypothetical protein
MSKIETLLVENGQIQLSGNTYAWRVAIKEAGGRWKPAEKVWILPAGTNLDFLGERPRCCGASVGVYIYEMGPWYWNCQIHGMGHVHRYTGD